MQNCLFGKYLMRVRARKCNIEPGQKLYSV